MRAAYEQLRDPSARMDVDMQLLELLACIGACAPRAKKLDLAVQSADVISAARALADLERSDWREHYEKVKL